MRGTLESYTKRWPKPRGWTSPALGPWPLLVVDGNYVLQSVIRGAAKAFEEVPEEYRRVRIGCAGFLSALSGALTAFPRVSHVIVTWDTGLDPWRREAYPDYKAGRKEKREQDVIDFQAIVYGAQALLKDHLAKLNVEQMTGFPGRDGVEADDLIALVCAHAQKSPLLTSVLVLSSDQDLTQLVKDTGVPVYFCPREAYELISYDDERAGVSPEMNLITEERVRARFGTLPPFIPLYKAIVGDPSDNLAGVPGLGAKTVRDVGLAYEGNLAAAVLDACNKRMDEKGVCGRFMRAFHKLNAGGLKRFRSVAQVATLRCPELHRVWCIPASDEKTEGWVRRDISAALEELLPMAEDATQARIQRSILSVFTSYYPRARKYLIARAAQ